MHYFSKKIWKHTLSNFYYETRFFFHLVNDLLSFGFIYRYLCLTWINRFFVYMTQCSRKKMYTSAVIGLDFLFFYLYLHCDFFCSNKYLPKVDLNAIFLFRCVQNCLAPHASRSDIRITAYHIFISDYSMALNMIEKLLLWRFSVWQVPSYIFWSDF